MKLNSRSRLQLRLQNALFILLFLIFIGLLAWLSTRYHYQSDWTATGRNTLSETSIELLDRMDGPIEIAVFSRDGSALQSYINDILARYQRDNKDLRVTFVDPGAEPERVRAEGITVAGEMVVSYQERREKLSRISEQGLSNLLQRLTRGGARQLLFVSGHGERSPSDQGNHDYGLWAQQLAQRGLPSQTINLATAGQIPESTALLVIAGPQVEYLPGEVRLIGEYLRRHGNLLWLTDPGSLFMLEPIAEQLGIEFQHGTVVDPTAQLFSIDDPTFAIVGEYGQRPTVQGFDLLTIFPRAQGVDIEPQDRWQGRPFLLTTERSWSESGLLEGEVGFDLGKDLPGPISLAVAATRAIEAESEESVTREQRVVVIGDGDFLSNAYLGNGGNLDLGMNIVNWLVKDERLISIPSRTAPDSGLELSQGELMVIGFGVLIVVPLGLLGCGLLIWWRRRRR